MQEVPKCRDGMGATEKIVSSGDRKSTRLNSSHSQISYAVFCLKKKTDARSAREAPGACSLRPGRGGPVAAPGCHGAPGGPRGQRCTCFILAAASLHASIVLVV